jgi:hypothetical protein
MQNIYFEAESTVELPVMTHPMPPPLPEPLPDMMPIDNSASRGLPDCVYVKGWDKMVADHPTRAAVLQALANLQIKAALANGPLPTQKIILLEIIECGLRLANGRRLSITISASSVKEVNRHINHHLIPGGYIVTRDDYEQNNTGGRGGPSAPWTVVSISRYIKDRMK